MTITREHFQKIIDDTFSNVQVLTKGKGTEYAGGEDVVKRNELDNFDRLSARMRISSEKVLWVYLTKHLDSIESYINDLEAPTRRPLSEPIEGRINDAILYLLLAKAMVVRRNVKTANEPMKVRPESIVMPPKPYPPYHVDTAGRDGG